MELLASHAAAAQSLFVLQLAAGQTISLLSAIWPPVLASLLALLTVAGSVAAFRVARNASVIAGYKEAAESSGRLVTALRAEVDQLESERNTLLAKSTAQAGQIETLTDLVTGRTAVADLATKLETHDEAIRGAIAGARRDILRAIGGGDQR